MGSEVGLLSIVVKETLPTVELLSRLAVLKEDMILGVDTALEDETNLVGAYEDSEVIETCCSDVVLITDTSWPIVDENFNDALGISLVNLLVLYGILDDVLLITEIEDEVTNEDREFESKGLDAREGSEDGREGSEDGREGSEDGREGSVVKSEVYRGTVVVVTASDAFDK